MNTKTLYLALFAILSTFASASGSIRPAASDLSNIEEISEDMNNSLIPAHVLSSCSDSKVAVQNVAELKIINGKAYLNNLSDDIIRYIATFLEPKDIYSLRNINSLTISSFKLKKLVEENFKIPGLESVKDEEHELAGIMSLPRISLDSFHFLTALAEDVFEKKKPYKVLFHPLIQHLFQTYAKLSLAEKRKYKEYFENKFNEKFENYMIDICVSKNYFDLVFMIVGDNSDLSGVALINAARYGRIEIVQLLLANHNHILVTVNVFTALNYAAQNGHTSVVELLLLSRSDITANRVEVALVIAVDNGHADVIEIILKNRTDILAYDIFRDLCSAAENGHTFGHTDIFADYAGQTLLIAVYLRNPTIVEHIIHNHKDIPINYVCEALEIAARGDETQIVQLIITDFVLDYACKVLCSAAQRGKELVVKVLLQIRNDIPFEDAGLALKEAAQKGHELVVKVLLQSRNDITVVDAGFALINAAERGHEPVVKVLLQSCNDIPADNVGYALKIAAQYGHEPVVAIILQSCNNIPDFHVSKALEYAARRERENTGIIQLLITYFIADDAGETLHKAAKNGYTESDKCLLRSRTDISDIDVRFALKKAAQNGHELVVKVLLQSRFDIPDDCVSFALESAAQEGHQLVLKILLQSRSDITSFAVGDALESATRKGYKPIVMCINNYLMNIPAYLSESPVHSSLSSS